MSYDLAKGIAKDALRIEWEDTETAARRVAEYAADRIEELEADLHLMKTAGIVEVSVRNPSVMEYMKHWEGRAEAAEAKLAKAVEERDETLNQLDSARHSIDVLERRVAKLMGEK